MLMNWSSPFPEEVKKTPRKKITNSKQFDNVEDEPLSDYVPPPKPERIERTDQRKPDTEPEANVYNTPAFEYSPYKAQDSALIDKLNYMIYLLEEQRDEKTGQITEELILYVFLGIFTLFVLDTFVKHGKYSR